MAVYLDTNQLHGWSTFTELNRLAISIVAAQLGQPLVLPQIVAEEAEAQFERWLQATLHRYEQAEADLTKLFESVEPGPDSSRRLDQWRAQRDEVFEIASLRAEDAVEGLRREMRGAPPAKPRQPDKPGAGARDVALWLSLVRDHRARGEESHFITANHKDFLRGGDLKPALGADLDKAPPLRIYPSTDAFVAQLGEATDDHPVELSRLQDQAASAVREGLTDSNAVAEAVFSDSGELRILSEIVGCEPRQIGRTRRDGVGVTLVTAQWDIEARCSYQQRTGGDTWYGAPQVHLRGPVQVYLRDGDREAPGQFIAARLQSTTTVHVMDDGHLLIGGPIADGYGDTKASEDWG